MATRPAAKPTECGLRARSRLPGSAERTPGAAAATAARPCGFLRWQLLRLFFSPEQRRTSASKQGSAPHSALVAGSLEAVRPVPRAEAPLPSAAGKAKLIKNQNNYCIPPSRPGTVPESLQTQLLLSRSALASKHHCRAVAAARQRTQQHRGRESCPHRPTDSVDNYVDA